MHVRDKLNSLLGLSHTCVVWIGTAQLLVTVWQ